MNMSSCAGPYTRVFFDPDDAAGIKRLAGALADKGWRAARLSLPRGRGGIDDLSCDMTFEDGAVVRVAKFLGPQKLFRQTHVYEIFVQVDDAGTGGSLFAPRLEPLIKKFLTNLPDLVAGHPVADLVAQEDAHEVRIELCNDL